MRVFSNFPTATALAAALITGVVSFAPAANASSFDFVDTADGVNAVITLDVVSGQAISGAGTLTSPFWTGSDNITLVTLGTPVVHDLGGGNLSYRFGGGTDLIGDTVFPPDGNGLVFSVANPSNPGLDLGFNIWSDGGNSYTGFLAGNAPPNSNDIIYSAYNGTGSFTVTTKATATPLPSTWVMLFGALIGFGFFVYRTQKNAAPLAAP